MPGDDMNTDQGLVAELIKLLGDELQRVRNEIPQLRCYQRSTSNPVLTSDASIYMLQEENMRLQQELRELAFRGMEEREVAAAVRDPRGQSPAEGLTPACDPDVHREHTDVEHHGATARLKNKLSANKQKYKQAKTRNTALRETIARTESLLQKIRSEQSCAAERLRTAEAELMRLEESLRVFSPKDFLSAEIPKDGTSEAAEASGGIVFQIGNSKLRLPLNVIDLCVPKFAGRFILKSHKKIIWADNSKTRCVALSPTHRYDTKAAGGNGGWETTGDMKRQPGEVMDMFFLSERTEWMYVGTYRCVGQTIMSLSEAGDFVKSVIDFAINRTTVGDPLPPVMQNAVKQMYAMGVLKFAWTGWQRISFNEGLARVLRGEKPQVTHGGQDPESASAAKRHRRDDESGGNDGKKRKMIR